MLRINLLLLSLGWLIASQGQDPYLDMKYNPAGQVSMANAYRVIPWDTSYIVYSNLNAWGSNTLQAAGLVRITGKGDVMNEAELHYYGSDTTTLRSMGVSSAITVINNKLAVLANYGSCYNIKCKSVMYFLAPTLDTIFARETGFDSGRSILYDGKNKLYVVGTKRPADTVLVECYDTMGVLQSSIRPTVLQSRKLGGIKRIEGDGYYAYGYSRTNATCNQWFPFVVKFDTSWNVVWDRTLNPGPGRNLITDIIVNDSGRVNGCGTAGMFVVPPPQCATYNRHWVFRLDRDGSLMWERKIGPTEWSNGGGRMCRSTDSSFFVCGTTVGPDDVGRVGVGYHVTVDGDSIDFSTYQHYSTENVSCGLSDVTRCKNKGFLCVGIAGIGLNGGAWILKLDSNGCYIPDCKLQMSSSIPEAEQMDTLIEKITIWPNPIRDDLNIEVPEIYMRSTTSLDIYTVDGRLIHHQSLTEQRSLVRSFNWESGIYVIRVSNAHRPGLTYKLVKQ